MALLSAEALQGVNLAISASDSADLGKLGLRESHFRFALGEIVRAVLVAGGEATYGGYIDSNGYGAFLASELQRFARRDRPFHAVLPWSEHRRMSVADLQSFAASLSLYGDLVCLDAAGKALENPYANRPSDADPITDLDETKAGLTAMRREVTSRTSGRIFVGGKKKGFIGDMPGVVEELLISAQSGMPVYLAGGFGGATYDLAVACILDGKDWMPADDIDDERYEPSLQMVRDLSKEAVAQINENGLTDEERKRLAMTHRASEIATLVSLGLGRRFAKK